LNENPKAQRLDVAPRLIVAAISIGAAFCWIFLFLGCYRIVSGIYIGQPFDWKGVFVIIMVAWLTMVTTYIAWYCIRGPRFSSSPKDNTTLNRWALWSSVLCVVAGLGLAWYPDPLKSTFLSHHWFLLLLGICLFLATRRRKSQ
jgi:hypothetical protein